MMAAEVRAAPEQTTKDVDLVFEGGGLKGIGLVGAYSVLEEQGYRPQNMAGASAGAIVAALVAAGYTAAELRAVVSGLDLHALEDRRQKNRLPLLPGLVGLLKHRGIYEGEAFHRWISSLLAAKGVRTFGDLLRRPEADTGEPEELLYRYRLQVIASDLTEERLLVLPRDADKLGIEDPDELEVALAVRMSMSIPVLFEPVSFTNPKTGREHLIVDGGMLSNFPVWLFDADEPYWPTIGLKFIEEDPRSPLGTLGSKGGWFSMVDYARRLVDTMMEAHDRLYLEESDFHRTIAIDPLGVGTTQFDLSRERALALYDSGRTAAEEFLAGKADGSPSDEFAR
jgi:NTE family protein